MSRHVRQDAPTPEATDSSHGHKTPAIPTKSIEPTGPSNRARPGDRASGAHPASSHRQFASEQIHARLTPPGGSAPVDLRWPSRVSSHLRRVRRAGSSRRGAGYVRPVATLDSTSAVPTSHDDSSPAGRCLVPGPLQRADPPPLRLPIAPVVRLVRDQRPRRTSRHRTSSYRALHPPSRGRRTDVILDQHDDARRPRLLPSRSHRRCHPIRPLRSTPDYPRSTATRPAPKASTGSSSSASYKLRRRSPFTTGRWPISSASTRSEPQKLLRCESRTTPRRCAATASSTSSAKAINRPRCRSRSQSCAYSKPAAANGQVAD